MDYKYLAERNNNKLSRQQAILSLFLLASIITLWWLLKPTNENKLNTHILKLPKIEQPTEVPQPIRTAAPRAFWHEETIRRGDSLTTLFKRLNLNADLLSKISSINRAEYHISNLKPGNKIKFLTQRDQTLEKIDYEIEPSQHLIIDLTEEIPTARFKKINLESHVHYTTVTIQNSFFAAGKIAGLTDQQIYTLVNYFAWEIDFARDIQPGDTLSVLYEDFYLGDKKVKSGPVVAANFVNQGHSYQIIRFETPDGDSHYYDSTGKSIRKAFLRSPVRYTHVSSTFDLRRRHPILHYRRPHEGVDLAAPYGTPIKTTGDGRVIFAGWKGGYGKMIIVRHNGKYSTRYAHMSRFAKTLKVGKRVKQGQVIGYVGSSGLATGPHVHYEFRINRRPYNPLKIKLPSAHPVPKHYKQQFLAKAKGLLAELDLYSSAHMAGHDNSPDMFG